jgi:hypothetical protein
MRYRPSILERLSSVVAVRFGVILVFTLVQLLLIAVAGAIGLVVGLVATRTTGLIAAVVAYFLFLKLQSWLDLIDMIRCGKTKPRSEPP